MGEASLVAKRTFSILTFLMGALQGDTDIHHKKIFSFADMLSVKIPTFILQGSVIKSQVQKKSTQNHKPNNM